jgi:hypothetical protein
VGFFTINHDPLRSDILRFTQDDKFGDTNI